MRRRRPEKREILPDPLFKDLVVAKFINNLMNDGKKSLAESIFYSSIEKIKTSINPKGIDKSTHEPTQHEPSLQPAFES